MAHHFVDVETGGLGPVIQDDANVNEETSTLSTFDSLANLISVCIREKGDTSTGVGVDASGNVWVTNNWKNQVDLVNPGGYEIVAFIGLAEPVARPQREK